MTTVRLGFTVQTSRQRSDLLVTAPSATPLGELLPDLARSGRLFVDGREVSWETPLSEAGVRDGAIISTRPQPPGLPTATPGSLALMVAAGAAAGASCTIPAGSLTVGRSSPLALADNEVSGRHFTLDMTDGITIADAGSTNGTVAAGRPLRGAQNLAEGDLIWAGRTALVVARAPAADAPLSPTADGQVLYSRSPRLAKRPYARAVVLPDPPPEPQRPPFPVLAVLVPLIAGLVMALVLREPQFLAFIALSPVMLIGNAVSERRRGARGHRQAMADYELRRTQAMAAQATDRQAELRYRRHVHPDPALLLLIATGPSCRLWERQPQDEDFLTLRVGTGTVPLNPGAPRRTGEPDSTGEDELDEAPVTLALPECGVAGITGSPARGRALARAMLLSVAVLHSPRDVSVTVLTSSGAAEDWNWLRWLPHARQPAESGGPVRIGNGDVSIRARLDELAEALQARRPDRDSGLRPARPEVHELVVLDGSYQLRRDAADLATLLREGPAVGMYFLCLDATPAQLPPECGRAVVQLSDDDGAIVASVAVPGPDPSRVIADVVTPAVAEVAARALAPLTETAGRAARDGLPDAVPFLTAAGLEPPGPARIRSRWAAGGRTTHALLGARSGARSCSIWRRARICSSRAPADRARANSCRRWWPRSRWPTGPTP